MTERQEKTIRTWIPRKVMTRSLDNIPYVFKWVAPGTKIDRVTSPSGRNSYYSLDYQEL